LRYKSCASSPQRRHFSAERRKDATPGRFRTAAPIQALAGSR
jgi:hypothetical protein